MPDPGQPRVAAATDLVVQDAPRTGWRLAEAVAHHRAEPAASAVQPQALAGQITLAVGQASDRRVEIRLDPPELGRVQIQLNPTDAGLQAVVLAERPETQDLLRRHAETLARDLNAAGYDNVSLDFAAGGGAAESDEPPPEQVRAAPPKAIEPAAATPAPRPTGALDIRL